VAPSAGDSRRSSFSERGDTLSPVVGLDQPVLDLGLRIQRVGERRFQGTAEAFALAYDLGVDAVTTLKSEDAPAVATVANPISFSRTPAS